MKDIFAFAWLMVTRHRLRSLLAVSGVAIGVCALTSILSVERSWQRAVEEFFADKDLETVQVSLPPEQYLRVEKSIQKIEPKDIKALVTGCGAVDSATVVTSSVMRAEWGKYAIGAAVRAVEPDFHITLPDEVREGRLFTAEENAACVPVCVLSLRARVYLFGDEPAVGRQIRLAGNRFEVVGIITGIDHAGIGGESIYVPLAWERYLIKSQWARKEVNVYAHTRDAGRAHRRIEERITQTYGEKSGIDINSLWEIRETALNSRRRTTLYSGLAGICALFVGGIGIASLLFVATSERSWEIGVCRAIGAARGRICAEYIFSGVILASAGCVGGAVLGIPAATAGVFASRWDPYTADYSSLLGYSAAKFPKMSDIALSVSWEAIGVAVTIALLTAAVTALAPAWEASLINPTEAIVQRSGTKAQLRKLLAALQVGFGVLVLVVLTSYFAVLQKEESAEARGAFGGDKISASADPIAALRKPATEDYKRECREAMAGVITSERNIAILRQQTPMLADLNPVVPLPLDVGYGGRSSNPAQIVFTTENIFNYSYGVDEGLFDEAIAAFSAGEEVIVMDRTLTQKLFGDSDPVGRKINVAGNKFTVISGPEYFGMGYYGGVGCVPIKFYKQLKKRARTDRRANSSLTKTRVDAFPMDLENYDKATQQLRHALLGMMPEEYHKIVRFSEYVPASTREFIMQHKAVAARGAVGALAVLLVALIGLANMLLVSVNDSMREMGIRRALGAGRPEVVLHFFSEGVVLSALGAIGGALAGVLVCWITKTYGGLPISASAFWIAAGTMATICAGAGVSIFPALISARISPVAAMRSE